MVCRRYETLLPVFRSYSRNVISLENPFTLVLLRLLLPLLFCFFFIVLFCTQLITLARHKLLDALKHSEGSALDIFMNIGVR